MTAVERRLDDIRNSGDESCFITIEVSLETGKGVNLSSKSTDAFCEAFTVRNEDTSADATAWSVIMTYKETLGDTTEAETKLTSLGTAMKSVDMYASVSTDKPYSETGQFELAAETPTPTPTPTPEPDEPDQPDDGGKDEDGAASLAVVAGAAISAATFLF